MVDLSSVIDQIHSQACQSALTDSNGGRFYCDILVRINEATQEGNDEILDFSKSV